MSLTNKLVDYARCCVDRPGKAIKMAPRDRSVGWEGLVEPLSLIAFSCSARVAATITP
jgi:hypothetical protein